MANSSFLRGKYRDYRTFPERTFDGITATQEDPVVASVDTKIVSYKGASFRFPNIQEARDFIKIYTRFCPFLGTQAREGDQVYYENGCHGAAWYVLFHVDSPGDVMRHYVSYAYLPNTVDNPEGF